MGLLVDGVWQDEWYDTKSSGGRFVRKDSSFRGWIRADGSTPFAPEPDRYHLYVSLACPWAHRTLIFRVLKRLEGAISVSVVHPLMGAQGWSFANPDSTAVVSGDPLNGAEHLHQIYSKADPAYTGRVTVPVLWDKQLGTIVSNESAEIIRMLSCGSEIGSMGSDLGEMQPESLLDGMGELVAPKPRPSPRRDPPEVAALEPARERGAPRKEPRPQHVR